MSIVTRYKSSLSAYSLILVNLFPLYAVLFLKWTLFSIMFLYWLENVIVGFYNIFKMAKAKGTQTLNFTLNGKPASECGNGAVIGFFILHYGIFMTVHGVFVFVLFGPPTMAPADFTWAFLLLFISHGISYFYNFIGRKEYETVSLSQQMAKPYSRLVIMHITILAGGFAAKVIGEPIWALMVMIVVKTAIDLGSHMNEHKAEPKNA